jgi:outer membrane protein OmpA-like peptidoglycan-associated protein
MRTQRFVIAASLMAVFCVAPLSASERETLSFGHGSPAAKEVEGFLFPEAECEHAKYQCLAVRPVVDRAIGVNVRFHTGSAELTPAARAQLEGIGKVLAGRGGKLQPGEIIIEGHTDARGSVEFNQTLSERRAESVVRHLTETYGVDPRALKPVGRGKQQLVDPRRPDAEVNRRVELVRRAK